MMDDFRDRTISRIFNSVISASSQYVSPCPPREKSSWQTFWSHLRRKNVNKKELNPVELENKIPDKIYKPPEKTNVVSDIEALYNTPYCNIKMQDPCEICCCVVCRAEDTDSPCDGVPRGQRKSVCECHPEDKYKKDQECCDACEHHGLRRI